MQNRAFYTREHRLHPVLIHRCHPLPGKLLSYIEIFFSYWVSIKWKIVAHLQSSVFKLSKDLIDSIHEEGIVAYTS